MKLQILVVGGVAVAGLGIALTVTNPSQQDYEDYAQTRLAAYLKDDVCTQAAKEFGGFLERQCQTIVDAGRPQIEQLIRQTTVQQNYVVFSIYSTDFDFAPILPAYHFETVGVLSRFYTYQAEDTSGT
jgi:hypothetical protein